MGIVVIKVLDLGICGGKMNIKEMRDMTGQTQKEFAESFGIPIGTLRRWEYGESTPAPYILRMIAEKLPMCDPHMKKIESKDETFYYDKSTQTITDCKGTRIRIHAEIDDVKEQNLGIYTKDLFEAYYEAVAKFNRACMFDKQEDILWG